MKIRMNINNTKIRTIIDKSTTNPQCTWYPVRPAFSKIFLQAVVSSRLLKYMINTQQ